MKHCNVEIATKAIHTQQESKLMNWCRIYVCSDRKYASNYHLSACNLQEIRAPMHQNAMEKKTLANNGSSDWFCAPSWDLRLWFFRSVMCAFLCSITASAHANRLTPLAVFFLTHQCEFPLRFAARKLLIWQFFSENLIEVINETEITSWD